MFIITVAVRTCTNVVDKLVHVRVENVQKGKYCTCPAKERVFFDLNLELRRPGLLRPRSRRRPRNQSIPRSNHALQLAPPRRNRRRAGAQLSICRRPRPSTTPRTDRTSSGTSRDWQ